MDMPFLIGYPSIEDAGYRVTGCVAFPLMQAAE